MTTIFVDTSALVALVDGDDPRNAAVRSAFAATSDADLVTHPFVVAETLAVARRRLGVPTTIRLIDDAFPLLRLLPIDPGLHAQALATYRASLPSGVSFVDRVTLAILEREAIQTVIAIDPDLAGPGITVIPPA